MSEFHERLKELRYSKALTQEAFARLGGVTINTQVNYEKGERFPNADYLMRLAGEDLDVNYLLTGNRIYGRLLLSVRRGGNFKFGDCVASPKSPNLTEAYGCAKRLAVC